MVADFHRPGQDEGVHQTPDTVCDMQTIVIILVGIVKLTERELAVAEIEYLGEAAILP